MDMQEFMHPGAEEKAPRHKLFLDVGLFLAVSGCVVFFRASIERALREAFLAS